MCRAKRTLNGTAAGACSFDADQTTFGALMTQGQKQETEMSATEIAKLHFSAAIAEAEAAGVGHDSICRSLLGLVVAKYLEDRSVSDVQSELRFVADNCDPGTDFMFMRP
ncbi:MAG: hypothetical protein Q8K88_06670 [Bradyrhizobium sp.]|nr:hypothetical protein [Bradyrhizobium sp.]